MGKRLKTCWLRISDKPNRHIEFVDANGTTCDENDEWYQKIVSRQWQKCRYEEITNPKSDSIRIFHATPFNKGYNQIVKRTDVIFTNPYSKTKANGKAN